MYTLQKRHGGPCESLVPFGTHGREFIGSPQKHRHTHKYTNKKTGILATNGQGSMHMAGPSAGKVGNPWIHLVCHLQDIGDIRHLHLCLRIPQGSSTAQRDLACAWAIKCQRHAGRMFKHASHCKIETTEVESPVGPVGMFLQTC